KTGWRRCAEPPGASAAGAASAATATTPATAQPGFPIAAEAAPTGQAGQRLDVSIARNGVAKTSARARRILGIRRAPLARHLAAIARPNSYTAGHASRDIAHATSRCDNAFAFL